MKKILPISAPFFILLFTACSHNQNNVKGGEIRKTIEQDAVQSKYIETLGIGAADSTLTNTTQRRATSRDAAIVQAQYEMLSIVKGIQLEGGITVQKAMETDSRLETTVKDTIRGAQIIKNEWTNDDGCVVTLRIERKRLESMMGVKFK